MNLVDTLLTSPVLVAAIPAVLAAIGGRYLLQAKDQHIATMKEAHAAELRARDAEIAALERWTPAKMHDHVQAIVKTLELRVELLTSERDGIQAALERSRDEDAREKARLTAELDEAQRQLVEADRARQDANEVAQKLAVLSATTFTGIGMFEGWIGPEAAPQ